MHCQGVYDSSPLLQTALHRCQSRLCLLTRCRLGGEVWQAEGYEEMGDGSNWQRCEVVCTTGHSKVVA